MRDGRRWVSYPKVPMEAASIERIRSLYAGYVLRSAPAVLPSHACQRQCAEKRAEKRKDRANRSNSKPFPVESQIS